MFVSHGPFSRISKGLHAIKYFISDKEAGVKYFSDFFLPSVRRLLMIGQSDHANFPSGDGDDGLPRGFVRPVRGDTSGTPGHDAAPFGA